MSAPHQSKPCSPSTHWRPHLVAPPRYRLNPFATAPSGLLSAVGSYRARSVPTAPLTGISRIRSFKVKNSKFPVVAQFHVHTFWNHTNIINTFLHVFIKSPGHPSDRNRPRAPTYIRTSDFRNGQSTYMPHTGFYLHYCCFSAEQAPIHRDRGPAPAASDRHRPGA